MDTVYGFLSVRVKRLITQTLSVATAYSLAVPMHVLGVYDGVGYFSVTFQIVATVRYTVSGCVLPRLGFPLLR